jgi:diketogulonate reductase-like aldo/keto reductase
MEALMPSIILPNGIKMPKMVMSSYEMDKSTLETVISEGLKIGYRAFDTARDYGTEDIVGKVLNKALKHSGMSRGDVFITTKIGNRQQIAGDIEGEIDKSLKNLQTDYIDLWLMHWPCPEFYIMTWKKMEKVYHSGKVKAIGIANCNKRYLDILLNAGVEVVPHCCQFELHPFRTCDNLVNYLRKKGVAIQAYSPLCRMVSFVRNSEILSDMSVRKGKSIAQIILRWHYQKGFVPVFKSQNPRRLKENFAIFDFSLSYDEMSAIDQLNCDYKFWLESLYCPGY